MMNHLIFSRFEPLVSNREIKIIHFDNSKMRLSIFSKMGKDPKKPKDDATVKKREKTFPVRTIVVRFSHRNRMQISIRENRALGKPGPQNRSIVKIVKNCEDSNLKGLKIITNVITFVVKKKNKMSKM